MNNLDDVYELIDIVILIVLKESKLVYISISCNFFGIFYLIFVREFVLYFFVLKYVIFFEIGFF